MFSKFKLNDIAYSDFEKYESEGKEYYEKTKTDIQNSLKEFIGKDGVVDGSGLQESWFSTKQKFDVFLSHSHTDEKLAISLAGFLKRELNLNTFIDSCLWGYDKQSNRAPTGTTILNARWSQVYLYTPSNGYGLWGTAATTFAHKTAQTSTLANKVSVSITTKWSEDTTNILYQ